MTPERLNFIYSFPAYSGCGNLSESEYKELEKLLISGGAPSKERQKQIVPTSFKRMEKNNCEWNIEGIRKYWWIIHNFLDDVHEPCHVRFLKIVKETDDKIIKVESKVEKELKVQNRFDVSLKTGYITSHKGIVIEAINEEDYEKYG